VLFLDDILGDEILDVVVFVELSSSSSYIVFIPAIESGILEKSES
jgi:hypothetical protein